MDSIVVSLVSTRALQYPIQEEDTMFVVSSVVEEDNNLPASVVLQRDIRASSHGAASMLVGGIPLPLAFDYVFSTNVNVRALDDFSHVVDTMIFVSGLSGISLEAPLPPVGTGSSFYWG